MLISKIREYVPWWLRIFLKIILARLPVSYDLWKRLGLFEHGDMNKPQRALDCFLEHAATAGILDRNSNLPRLALEAESFSVLEIGPGDSLFTGIVAYALGATKSWLVDASSFATHDYDQYEKLVQFLRRNGYEFSLDLEVGEINELLKQVNSEYLTSGVDSLVAIQPNSVDFCFSNAVIEHIPKEHMSKLASELYRVLKKDGVCVHRVDLKDHLGGGLNSLRFSDERWEGSLFSNSGFYTNRMRFSHIKAIFEEVGFDCMVPRTIRWERLPLPRRVIDESFQKLSDEELKVSGFDLVLKKN